MPFYRIPSILQDPLVTTDDGVSPPDETDPSELEFVAAALVWMRQR
jgi:hypothetical protein